MRNPTRQSVVTSDQADAAVTLVIGSTGPDAVEVEVDPKSELGKIIAAYLIDARAAKATPAE